MIPANLKLWASCTRSPRCRESCHTLRLRFLRQWHNTNKCICFNECNVINQIAGKQVTLLQLSVKLLVKLTNPCVSTSITPNVHLYLHIHTAKEIFLHLNSRIRTLQPPSVLSFPRSFKIKSSWIRNLTQKYDLFNINMFWRTYISNSLSLK
jgi:hypothetical protein